MSPWSPGRRRQAHEAAAGRGAWCECELLGRDSVLMFTTAGPTCLTMVENPLERVTGMEWRAGERREFDVLLLHAADVAGEYGAGENADGEDRKKRECSCEARLRSAVEQSRGSVAVCCVHWLGLPHWFCWPRGSGLAEHSDAGKVCKYIAAGCESVVERLSGHCRIFRRRLRAKVSLL